MTDTQTQDVEAQNIADGVSKAYGEIVDFIMEKNYPPQVGLIALCRVYCATASFFKITPDDFMKVTMTDYAKAAGFNVAFVGEDESTPENETIQ